MAYSPLGPGASLRASQSIIAANFEALRGNSANTSTPSDPQDGQLFYNTSTDMIFIRDESFSTSDFGSDEWAALGDIKQVFQVGFDSFTESGDGVAEAVTLRTLPANAVITFVRVKVLTEFAGPALTSLGLEIGDSGDPDRYLTSYECDSTPSDTNLSQAFPNTQLSAASFGLLATFTPNAGESLDDMTAGAVEVWVGYFVLP
jgi:hypothetical protein